jgi:hypothetical protein
MVMGQMKCKVGKSINAENAESTENAESDRIAPGLVILSTPLRRPAAGIPAPSARQGAGDAIIHMDSRQALCRALGAGMPQREALRRSGAN